MNPASLIDLRSDTVTRPTSAMRAAMADAPVGDDQYGEDALTNLLQARMAELLGKPAALWLPSGTMANQVALRVLTRPGDEVIVSRECHAAWHETGGSAANSGVQLHAIGQGGVFSAEEAEAAIKPAGLPVYPPTTLLEIENTHNRAGGVVFPQAEVVRICAMARTHGLATFLDGARLWNASVASGLTESELAAPFDLVGVSFSKGLGAPGGSLLAGSRELIDAATRQRRMLGGAMRQTGFFAAAALHAVDHHRARLAEDHDNARHLAQVLAAASHVRLDMASVQTNIVVFHLEAPAMDAKALVAAARARGVLLNAFGARTVRAVTHLDVSREQAARAATLLAEILG
jgi:threonine aldolase